MKKEKKELAIFIVIVALGALLGDLLGGLIGVVVGLVQFFIRELMR